LPVNRGAVEVTKGSEKGPASELQCRLYAAAGPVGANVVVELGKGGQHALHQVARRCVVDWFGGRSERDPERLEMRSFESELLQRGVQPGAPPSIPDPHVHHYHAERDNEERAVLQALDWHVKPLRESDVQFVPKSS
jgi:hypothetical protein